MVSLDGILVRARLVWEWCRPLLFHILIGDPEEVDPVATLQLRREEGKAENVKTKRNKIAIIHEIFYVWRVTRICFLLPATFTEKGLISFRWKSWPTILTLAAWMFMVPCGIIVSYLVAVKEIKRSQVKSHGVQEISQLLTLTLSTLFDIFLPISVFASMRSFTNFTASWTRMEIKYTTLTGAPPHLGIKPFIYTLFVANQIYFIPVLVALHDQIGLEFWMMVPLTHALVCMLSCFVIWVSGYVAVAVLSYGLARRLIADTESQGVAGLRLHRLLWLHIVKMYHSCWAWTQGPFIFFMFIICTVYFYNFFQTLLVKWDEILQCIYGVTTTFSCKEYSVFRVLGQNVLVFIASGVGLLVICLSAHAATHQINSTRKKVLRLSLSGKSRIFQYEVFSFLDDIRGTEVTLRLSRFIDIGRPRIITMMVIALTYCIVLSQFALLDT